MSLIWGELVPTTLSVTIPTLREKQKRKGSTLVSILAPTQQSWYACRDQFPVHSPANWISASPLDPDLRMAQADRVRMDEVRRYPWPRDSSTDGPSHTNDLSLLPLSSESDAAGRACGEERSLASVAERHFQGPNSTASKPSNVLLLVRDFVSGADHRTFDRRKKPA